MAERIKWWGYLHINGSIQVKRFFNIKDIEEAEQSSFVKSVYGPFTCDCRDNAVEILKTIYLTKTK